VKEGGISKFLRKLGTGYAMYFNKKYDRMGHLFQGFFKAVHINTDDQLKTDFVYIHTNGISLIEPKWKEVGIKNPDKVIDFLENKFRWSSLWDYFGKKNFPSVTERDFMLKIMEDEQGCREAIENWVKYKGEIRI
jgi:putative transposase